jgi:hypothetical protein
MLLFTAISASSIVGCASSFTFMPSPKKRVVLTDHATYLMYSGGKVQSGAKPLPARAGDTIEVIGRVVGWGGSVPHAYLSLLASDTVYILSSDLIPLSWAPLAHQSAKFRLPTTQDPTAWGRAIVYIQRHSSVKVQTASDNLVQTFNPIDPGDRGFTVTRVPMGDSVEYDAKKLDHVIGESPSVFLALFMATGIDADDLPTDY